MSPADTPAKLYVGRSNEEKLSGRYSKSSQLRNEVVIGAAEIRLKKRVVPAVERLCFRQKTYIFCFGDASREPTLILVVVFSWRNKPRITVPSAVKCAPTRTGCLWRERSLRICVNIRGVTKRRAKGRATHLSDAFNSRKLALEIPSELPRFFSAGILQVQLCLFPVPGMTERSNQLEVTQKIFVRVQEAAFI